MDLLVVPSLSVLWLFVTIYLWKVLRAEDVNDAPNIYVILISGLIIAFISGSASSGDQMNIKDIIFVISMTPICSFSLLLISYLSTYRNIQKIRDEYEKELCKKDKQIEELEYAIQSQEKN
jgi:hypothetical protein